MEYSNKWALITGASSGIGAAFARAYAARGANVVLVARREERLNQLAEELKSKHSVQTKVISSDLSLQESPDQIKQDLDSSKINIDILVNNAGLGVSGNLLEHDWKTHQDFIELMVTQYVKMSYLFLPGMLERGYGRVIQVASVAGLIPGSAGHTLYGASKAFLVSFSESLAGECQKKGVHVTALCPGFVYTEFHDVSGTRKLVSKLPKYLFMEAEPVVEGAISAVEHEKTIYVPGLFNKCLVAFVHKLLPRSWAEALMLRNSKKFHKNP